MEDFDIVLLPDFSTPRDEVQQAVQAAHAVGREIAIEFKIAGQFGLTDTRRLAEQFLYAAYIGEAIAKACTKFECEAPSSIQAHESVEFHVVPRDVEEFMTQLWDSIPALMSEELLAQNGYNEDENLEITNECWGASWDLIGSPRDTPNTTKLADHAEAMLRAAGYSEDDEDDD
jgi:hypothetical protein